MTAIDLPSILQIEVEVRDGHVKNITCQKPIAVHVYDYSKTWSKEVTEPDEEGFQCRQTIWQRHVNKGALNSVKVYIREGSVTRVVMPPGTDVLINTYVKGEAAPKVKRWHRKPLPT